MARNQATGQEVGAVYVSVMPSGQGFSRSMDKDLDGAFTGAATRGTATFGQMFRRVAAIGAGFLATIGLGKLVKSTVELGVSYNTLEQSSKAAFTTLLGTADAAVAMQKQIREFASKSPFPRQAFIEATQQLLSFGFSAEQVVPTLQSIQDAVAAIGGNASDIADITAILAKIRSGATIGINELDQLASHGINGYATLAKAQGMTEDQFRDSLYGNPLKGKAALVGLDALIAGMEEKFGGAAANLKGTFVGAKDRIAGAWRDISSELVAPFVDPNGGGFAVKWANEFADLLRKIQGSPAFDTLKKKLQDFGGQVDVLVSGGLKTLGLLFEENGVGKFVNAIKGIAERFPGLQIFLDIMGALQPLMPAIVDAVKDLGPQIERLAPQFTELVKALLPLIPPLVEATIALLPALIDLVPKLVDLAIPLLQLLVLMAPGIVAFANAIGWLLSFQTGLFTFLGQVIDFFVKGGGSVTDFARILYGIPGPLGDVTRGIYNFMRGIIGMFTDTVNGFIGGIEAAMNAVLRLVNANRHVTLGRLSNIPELSQFLTTPGGQSQVTRSVTAMADGGTILPRPGGTLILAAEAGRAESVVDTGKLNNVLDSVTNGSGSRPIYADGIGLIGWLKEVAGQEARLVFATGVNRAYASQIGRK